MTTGVCSNFRDTELSVEYRHSMAGRWRITGKGNTLNGTHVGNLTVDAKDMRIWVPSVEENVSIDTLVWCYEKVRKLANDIIPEDKR